MIVMLSSDLPERVGQTADKLQPHEIFKDKYSMINNYFKNIL